MVARKKDDEQVSMIDSFREFKDTKNIDRTTLVSVLEESLPQRAGKDLWQRRKL